MDLTTSSDPLHNNASTRRTRTFAGGRAAPRLAAIGLVAVLGVAAVGCGDSDGSGPSGTTPVSVAQAAFCDDLGNAIAAVDQYARVFSEGQVTIGDLKTSGSALAASQADVEGSATQLADSIEAANRLATAGTGSTTTIAVLATMSADDHLDAIRKAQRTFDDATDGVDASTPVSEAAADLQVAGFALQQAYVSLFVDAGCLADDAEAARALNDYVGGIQKDLTTLGFYTGAVDGLYGPETVAAVKALQASAGLPQSGVVDPATEASMAQQLAAKGEQQALNVAALQGVLTAAGYYTGPIDGAWTPAVEDALKAYQTAQNLPPTGTMDAATLAALLSLGRPAEPAPTTTTTAAAGSTTSTTTAPTTTTAP
jgi:peptidoglycan hydrolase-like protein with peptidoglycan-binding domain